MAFLEERIVRAAEILDQTPADRQIQALKEANFRDDEAHRIVALLPLAFSRPVLEELGVRHFVPVVTAVARDGTLVEASLMRQPEYVAALKLARKHRRQGAMDHEVYKRITGGSADIDAASKALSAGASLLGSTIASTLIGSDIAERLIT